MQSLFGLRRSPHANDAGVAMVEFALVLPLLLTLVLGMVDFGKAFNYWIDETHLANEGARWAVVDKNPGAASGLSLQQYIQKQAAQIGGSGLANTTVCVRFPEGTQRVGDPVEVTIKIAYKWLQFFNQKNPLPFMGGTKLNFGITTPIAGSATMRLEGPPTNYSAGGVGPESCP
jgi:hypothetical protein